MSNKIFRFFIFAVLLAPVLALPFAAHAQKRDYLTEAEIEIVRDTQELDKRTAVFVKAVDRRFQALGVAAPQIDSKKAKKDKDKSDWGAPPVGTRAELLNDISGILDAAMTNINDVYGRSAKNPLIAVSLKTLAEAAARFQSQLKPLAGKAESERERDVVYQIEKNLEKIIEAPGEYAKETKPTN